MMWTTKPKVYAKVMKKKKLMQLFFLFFFGAMSSIENHKAFTISLF